MGQDNILKDIFRNMHWDRFVGTFKVIDSYKKCLTCNQKLSGETSYKVTLQKKIFDGTYYRDIENNKAIQKVKNFELGALYEIGRLLAKSGITFLG